MARNQVDVIGAYNELFVECPERAAAAAHCNQGHSCILLCGTIRVVIFRLGGLWLPLVHSLNADHPT
jgi:hypothetical protein